MRPRKPSPGTIIAIVALLVALSGSASRRATPSSRARLRSSRAFWGKSDEKYAVNW